VSGTPIGERVRNDALPHLTMRRMANIRLSAFRFPYVLLSSLPDLIRQAMRQRRLLKPHGMT
jgi:hypothetical protein